MNLSTTIPAGLKLVSLMVFSTLFFQTTIPFKTLAQTTYTFTNCSATGRTGPTQTQVNAAYSGTSLAGAVTINTQGIQEWVVPVTGNYSIAAYGAQGGNSGGAGASITGTFSLTQGDVLKIVVGQKGVDGTVSGVTYIGGGGGGGSYVMKSPYMNAASILVIAGGGGGLTNFGSTASISGLSGNNGGSTYNNGGGTNGNGGNNGISDGPAAGGGGVYSNGTSGENPGVTSPGGGLAFVNGSLGGISGYSGTVYGGEGGFGGGGGAYNNTYTRSGGGGGYSGGQGGGWSGQQSGGGGGSYNSGVSQSNISGARTGHGQVVFTFVPGEFTFDYTGSYHAWTVPSGVSAITIEAYGAQGGTATSGNGYLGGYGGYAKGDLAVTPGQTLYFYVGGQGTGVGNFILGGGGWNGGGHAQGSADGGGGASDVRSGGTNLSNRVIVAGGGGGNGYYSYAGGAGGGTTGSSGGNATDASAAYGGSGGTQSAGGTGSGTYPGSSGTLGVGGNGGIGSGLIGYSGGGGGGYYGGAGGAGNVVYGTGYGAAGGGGSSYIGGVTNATTSAGLKQGNGQIIISYTVVAGPTIYTTGTLTAFTSVSGIASASQSFSTSGSLLTEGIAITAPNGFEISLSSGSGYATSLALAQSSGSVANTTIYVRMAASATGTPSGNIELTSAGATTINIAVSGTVYAAPYTQANNIVFSSITNVSTSISWTNGNGSSRAVFMKAANTGTASPVNGTTYTASTSFGSGTQIGSTGWYCVYNGTGSSVSVSNLQAATAYIVMVTEFNGISGAQVYSTSTASNNPNTFYSTATFTYSYTGTMQSWTVPAGVYSVNIKTWGAQGYPGSAAGGLGGYATGDLAVTPGQVLYIFVGGQGGYNGGGTGGLGQNGTYGGNGGGASDVRTGGTALSNRVIVAGGGGGGGRNGTWEACQPSPAGAGGSGGGSAGTDGYSSSCNCAGGGTGGGAGTLVSGGYAGSHTGACTRAGWTAGTSGSVGVGGVGSTSTYTGSGGAGGGGGGFFGGGAGGNGSDTTPGGGGGGGSSNTDGTTNASKESGVRSGDGQIIISCNTSPAIAISGSLSAFNTCSGTASTEQSFTTSGSWLTANITVTAPTGFELSTTSGGSFSSTLTLTQTGGTVSSTTIYVRMASSATGTPSGNITLASSGATTQNVAVSGTLSSPPTVNAGNDQTVSTASANLNGSISGSASTGAWSGGAGTYSPDNTSLTATYTPTAAERLAGSLTLTLTSADPAGPCGSATDQVTLTFSAADKISITDGYWETSETWSPAGVPTLIDNVTINHSVTVNSSVAADPAICNNLSVNSGKLLTIESGKALTINGNLSNPAGAAFTIASGGSLITNGSISNNGTFTVQRTITKDRWHLISSPVTDATAQVFENDYLQSWSEVNAEWTDIISTGTALNPAQGYGLWTMYSSDHTYSFIGTPNTGNQNVQLTVSSNFPDPETGNDGANILGNPYPSAIDWSMLDNTYGAAYYWQGNGTNGEGTYLSWNNGSGQGSQYIAPMQGFFIVAPSAGTFSLSNANRTHTVGSYYKSAEETKDNLLVLGTVSKGISDRLYLNFNNDATEDFDLQHDAYKFASGTAGLSELYSFTGDKKLSIDVRPECEVIQLGFSNSLSGTYSISINQINGISKATLEDTKTNTFTNLLKGSYAFSWAAGEDNKRFKLHMGTVGVDESQDSDISIYSYQKTAYINLKNQLKGDVYIFNMAGQLITSVEKASGLVSAGINTPGIYLVKVVSNNKTSVAKILIR